jgi:hypothetical protein
MTHPDRIAAYKASQARAKAESERRASCLDCHGRGWIIAQDGTSWTHAICHHDDEEWNGGVGR